MSKFSFKKIYLFIFIFISFFIILNIWFSRAFVKQREDDPSFIILPFQEAKEDMNINGNVIESERFNFAKQVISKRFVMDGEYFFNNDRSIKLSIFNEVEHGGIGLRVYFMTNKSCKLFLNAYAENAFFQKKAEENMVSPWFSEIDFSGRAIPSIKTLGLKSPGEIFSDQAISWCESVERNNKFVIIHGF